MNILNNNSTIHDKIAKLRRDIKPYKRKEDSFIEDNLYMFNFRNIYLIIPACVFLLLLLFQPTFIKKQKIDENGFDQQSLDFSKFLLYWMIISGIIVVILYSYNYKKSINM